MSHLYWPNLPDTKSLLEQALYAVQWRPRIRQCQKYTEINATLGENQANKVPTLDRQFVRLVGDRQPVGRVGFGWRAARCGEGHGGGLDRMASSLPSGGQPSQQLAPQFNHPVPLMTPATPASFANARSSLTSLSRGAYRHREKT
jgi:hypothetical protein